MADTFQLDIVTPEGTLFSGRAEELVAPGVMGEFGVLPGHADMLAELGVGGVRYRSGGNEYVLAAGGGLAEVTAERVTVLLDRALFPEDVRVDEFQAAMAQAEQNKYEPQDGQYAEWRRSLQWMALCLEMAGDQGRKGQ
jgi:F-type H+-transporting ATPase subunit epsilon